MPYFSLESLANFRERKEKYNILEHIVTEPGFRLLGKLFIIKPLLRAHVRPHSHYWRLSLPACHSPLLMLTAY